MQVATSGQRPTRYCELFLTRTTHPSSTKRNDARRWVSRGCYDSHVTGGHGCLADGNGGYGQPVATAGPRAHDRAQGLRSDRRSGSLRWLSLSSARHDAEQTTRALPPNSRKMRRR